MLRPRIGINPIALHDGHLYYGAMHGTKLFRVPVDALTNAELDSSQIAESVQFYFYAEKPISDGISIDQQGNIYLYLGDLPNNAIAVIHTDDRRLETLARDARLSWVDAFSFRPAGRLYGVANQLRRTSILNGGNDTTQPPSLIFAMQPLAPGTPGR
jgi:sugar lactone lactonase YvrE